jgi:tetratricopeptide (TPR) repeat protein
MKKALFFAIFFSVCFIVVAFSLHQRINTKPAVKHEVPVIRSGISRFYTLYATHMKAGNAMMSGDYVAANNASAHLKDELTPDNLAMPGADGNMWQYIYQTQLLTLVRFGKWEEALRDKTVDTLVYAALLSHFARGMAEARLHRINAAEDELEWLEAALMDAGLKISSDLLEAMYCPGTIARDILTGVIAAEKKKYREAITTLEEAVVTEDALPQGKIRYWMLPARHYLGDVYLQMKEYQKAIHVFNADLAINSGNIWALQGLILAYTAVNDATGIKNTREKMANNYSGRRIERPVF